MRASHKITEAVGNTTKRRQFFVNPNPLQHHLLLYWTKQHWLNDNKNKVSLIAALLTFMGITVAIVGIYLSHNDSQIKHIDARNSKLETRIIIEIKNDLNKLESRVDTLNSEIKRLKTKPTSEQNVK